MQTSYTCHRSDYLVRCTVTRQRWQAQRAGPQHRRTQNEHTDPWTVTGRRGVSKTNAAVGTLVSVHTQASALLPRGDSLLYGCAEEWPRPNLFTHFTGRRNYTLASSHLLGRMCIQQHSYHQSDPLPIIIVCISGISWQQDQWYSDSIPANKGNYLNYMTWMFIYLSVCLPVCMSISLMTTHLFKINFQFICWQCELPFRYGYWHLSHAVPQ